MVKDWKLEDFAGVFTLDSTSAERISELLRSMKPADIAKVCESWNPDGEILKVRNLGQNDQQDMGLIVIKYRYMNFIMFFLINVGFSLVSCRCFLCSK